MTVGPDHERSDPSAAPAGLTRRDLAEGLRDLVAALTPSVEPVRLRLIGGAAISLLYDSDRRRTVDVDGQFSPRAAVLDVARIVGERHGWSDDWINDAAVQFLPTGYGTRGQEWETVYDDGHVVIEIGSAAMLLAMKLYAAQRRGAREMQDISVLAAATGTTTVDDAEELFGAYYPGDEFTPRTARIVQDALDSGYRGRTAPFPDLS